MHRYLSMAVLSLIILIFFLPALIIYYPEKQREDSVEKLTELKLTDNIKIKVYDHLTGKNQLKNLEEYLIGVVAAEMPANFHLEALKAQAIAARTYALKRLLKYRAEENPLHPGSDICTSFEHNQAWIDDQQMKKNWGQAQFEANYNRIKQAVWETQGKIAIYHERLIDPVFHADCGGHRTENAEDVWQGSVPYLVSVECLPRWDLGKTTDKRQFALSNIDTRLGTNLAAIPVGAGQNNSPIKVLDKTEAGRIKAIKLGSRVLTGGTVREALDLKSTNFELEINNGELVVTTLGYGHGVGLCQVGANEYAKKGKNYQQILTHYYTGAKVVSIGKN